MSWDIEQSSDCVAELLGHVYVRVFGPPVCPNSRPRLPAPNTSEYLVLPYTRSQQYTYVETNHSELHKIHHRRRDKEGKNILLQRTISLYVACLHNADGEFRVRCPLNTYLISCSANNPNLKKETAQGPWGFSQKVVDNTSKLLPRKHPSFRTTFRRQPLRSSPNPFSFQSPPIRRTSIQP